MSLQLGPMIHNHHQPIEPIGSITIDLYKRWSMDVYAIPFLTLLSHTLIFIYNSTKITTMFGNLRYSSPDGCKMSTSDAVCRFKALPIPFDDLDGSMMTSPEYPSHQRKSSDSDVSIDLSSSGYDSMESSPCCSPNSSPSLTVCHKTPRASHRPRRSLFSSESRHDGSERSIHIEHDNVSRDYKQTMASGSVTCLSGSDASDSGALIKSALDNDDEDTIGDFSKPYCLPTIPGNHSDLKSISVQTVSHLLNRQFSDTVVDFTISLRVQWRTHPERHQHLEPGSTQRVLFFIC